MSRKREWIGVDLDGTLAHYEKFRGIDHIGEPVVDMLARVKAWLVDGKDVRIFTARVAHDGTADKIMESHKAMARITEWCKTHLGQVLPVTCTKDFAMMELWDDRAVQVEKNTGRPVGFSTRGHV